MRFLNTNEFWLSFLPVCNVIGALLFPEVKRENFSLFGQIGTELQLPTPIEIVESGHISEIIRTLNEIWGLLGT